MHIELGSQATNQKQLTIGTGRAPVCFTGICHSPRVVLTSSCGRHHDCRIIAGRPQQGLLLTPESVVHSHRLEDIVRKQVNGLRVSRAKRSMTKSDVERPLAGRIGEIGDRPSETGKHEGTGAKLIADGTLAFDRPRDLHSGVTEDAQRTIG